MRPFRFLWIPGLVTVLAVCSAAQTTTQIKKEGTPVTSAASGQKMYMNYCASCHGANAKGDGPAAPALKTAPPDLTTLAKQNGGKFPALHVTSILEGKQTLAAHGSQEMPVWGPVFQTVSGRDESIVKMRIANLTRYLESLQEK